MRWLAGTAVLCLMNTAAWAQNSDGMVMPAGSEVELKNPDFEGAFEAIRSTSDAPGQKSKITGQLAEGWADNSDWADVDVHYSRETTNAHRGAAQKIEITRFGGGAVQFVQPAQFKKGRIHLWRVWLRGQPGTSVSLMLRKGGAPYTTYTEQTATLSAEWKEFRVFGAIPEDTDGFLMIRASQPMTFWVDDSTLLDLTEAKSDAVPRVGNIIPSGGSFEAGRPFGWTVRFQGAMENRFADPKPKYDRTTSKHGQVSMRCDLLPNDDVRIDSPIFDFNYNRPHIVSVWLKAAKPNTSVHMRLEKTEIQKSVNVGTEWQRFTLGGTLPFMPFTRLSFYIPSAYAKEGNTLWLDGVQVEEKAEASADYQAPFPVELSLELPRPGHIVLDGDKANVRITTAGNLPPNAQLKLSAQELGGTQRELGMLPLPASQMPIPAMSNRRGMWKLRAQVVQAGGKPISAPFDLIWSRLPKPKNIDARNSYFGIHIPLAPQYITMAKNMGMRRLRLHDTSMIAKWPIAEPRPGEWKYFDEGVTMAHQNGLRILGMLDGAPAWTSTTAREGGYWGIWHIPDRPDALPKWEEYVRRVTSHYKGRIDDWELWNEPWGAWWMASGNPNATPELYAQLMKSAYRITKQQNPNAYFIGVDTYRGHDAWTEGVLKHANSDYYDGFSFHDYNDALFGGPASFPQSQRKLFTDFQNKYGKAKPMWNTEGGVFGVGSWYVPAAGGMEPLAQPAYMVRYDVTYMGAGIKAFWLYAIHTDPAMGEIDTRNTEYDNSIKPMLAARAVLASLVDGMGTPKRSEPVKGVDLYTYGTTKPVQVLWSYDGATHNVPIPRGVKVLDIWGNPISTKANLISVGPEPKYFIR